LGRKYYSKNIFYHNITLSLFKPESMKGSNFLSLLFCLLLGTASARASHLYGGELYYTHVSGSLYRITMVLYGDCAGSIFSTLPTSSPEVKVYKGTALYRTLNLKILAPSAGVEITPVCPSSLGATACNGGSIPGVKKFVYSDTVTLTPAANWRLRSTGVLSAASSSGRSGSITNIFSSSTGNIMTLEATLNNSLQENSSPTYTTVPTPFFCINTLQEYNPGAVDSNATDSLRYQLVDGFDGTTGTVTYRAGYSATAPLASAAGTFSFSGSNGQLTFKPNLTQVSMVVYKVSEYRGGVLVGTSMREMNFIVLSTCSNRSPSGSIRNVAGGILTDSFSVRMCKNDSLLSFNINPVDSDGNAITMSVKGLPAGAVMTITGNGTTTPTSSFSWNTASVSPGFYYFYITYQDDGCPISSKQTIAYTIQIVGKPTATVSTVTEASCIAKAVIDIIPSIGSPTWTLGAYSGTTLLHTLTGTSSVLRDSLSPGTYIYRITSGEGCVGGITHVVNPPPPVTIGTINSVAALCKGSADGKVTVTPAGGKFPFQYQVNGGAFSALSTITGLSAGTYSLRVQDANTCFKDTSFTISEPPAVTINSFSASGLKCYGIASGTAGIIASGGTTPYLYRIDGGSYGSSGSFAALFAGTHTIMIMDANGCTKDTVFVLTQAPRIGITSMTITQPQCHGSATGSVSFSAAGGAPPYNYSIDGGSYGTAVSFTALASGMHTIRVRDTSLCVWDTSFMMNEPAAVGAATLSIIPPSCMGTATGSVSVSGNGGTSPYTYRINGGTFGTSGTFGSLPAGGYTISIRDAYLCTTDISFLVTEPAKLAVSALKLTAALCKGTSTGTAVVAASGGTAPFQYKIDGGSFTSSVTYSGLAAGTHTISIRDTMLCSADTTFIITEPDALRIQSLQLGSPLCKGGMSGVLTVMAGGGTVPYNYSVDGGPFGKSGVLSALGAGTHTVRVRDTNFCLLDTTVILSEPDSVSAVLGLKKATCDGVADGVITVDAKGGTRPYLYALNGGTFGSSATFPALANGTYVITVKDSNSCTRSYHTVIEDSVVLKADLTTTDVSCYGWVNGSITVTPLNGKSPYTFAIATGSFRSSPSFKAISAGTYAIRMKDAYGCLYNGSATVLQPDPLTVMVKSTMPTCKGNVDGSLEITASGGSGPYLYAIDGKTYGATGLFSKLAPGSYTLSVKDAQGCTKDTTVELVEPPVLYLSVVTQMPLCHSGADGSIELTSSGGTPAYLYTISAGAGVADPVFRGLKSGHYPVSVIDNNGCRKDTTVFLSQPDALGFKTLKVWPPTCEDYANGAISAGVSGGTPPYRYAITTGGYTNSSSFIGLKSGEYTLSVIDQNNCAIDTVFTLKGYPKIILDSIISQMPTCFERADGSFLLFVSGGTAPIRFVSEAITGDTVTKAAFDKLKAGTYVVKAIDSVHCSKDFFVTIAQPEELKLSLSVLHNDCTGTDNAGSIAAEVSGGTSPYRYLWSNQNQADSFIYGLANGPYSVLVKDRNDCRDSADAEITYDNCCKPSIPNAFTPNNDAINDIFRIIYKGDIVLKEFIIYNRYGQQVFATTNINEGWDGTFLGLAEQVGVYYYYIRMFCGNNKDHEVMFKGDITLIR
jgi:gliding motility-associated-like protein